jgi:hypothetical protein
MSRGDIMIESVREMNQKYSGEWLMLVNTKNDEHGNLTEGEVVAHSRNKDAIFKCLKKHRYPQTSTTIRYGGYIPEGFIVEM